uniref:GT23 domain-containing protein n=1 Tax=Ciona savignyi TaxID=51511 RepID=H2ZED1_CIOSA
MMLSKCDFLVCTLSSELATVAYELMQVRDWQAADNYVSLDHIYGGALAIPAKFHQAVLGHKRNNYTEELSLEFGDMLFTQMDNSSGFFYGGNNRTGKFGWYPSYKVKESTQFFSQMDKRAWEVSGGNEAQDDQGNKIKLYITFD